MVLDSPVRISKRKHSLDTLRDEVLHLARQGGPEPHDYAALNRLIRQTGDEIRAGIASAEEVKQTIDRLTDIHFSGTLQAAARRKTRGYSGDFEIIDAIYGTQVTRDPDLRRWDLFFQAQAAPCAVRNRKAHFLRLLADLPQSPDGNRLRVLNVGSGPGRDLREWFLSQPTVPVFFDCVEMDAQAIDHASRLCRPFLQHIEFYHENVLRYVPSRGYDLAWSAGLFDYLNDRVFVRLLKALLAVVRPGGRVVVGNFSEFNPSRDYMEIFGDWHLQHRSAEHLTALARQAGAAPAQCTVSWEPEGVNLFLEIQVP